MHAHESLTVVFVFVFVFAAKACPHAHEPLARYVVYVVFAAWACPYAHEPLAVNSPGYLDVLVHTHTSAAEPHFSCASLTSVSLARLSLGLLAVGVLPCLLLGVVSRVGRLPLLRAWLGSLCFE